MKEPSIELDVPFSDSGAVATPWRTVVDALKKAEIFWLSTVRPDGRPHTTPLCGVWLDGALYFCTGDLERKAKNIASNSSVTLTTGTNAFREGFDVVVDGEAVVVTDDTLLRRLRDEWIRKFDWPFDVTDGAFRHEEGTGRVPVFEVSPRTIFCYVRGDTYGATRYRF